MADLLGRVILHKRLRSNPVWERADYGYCWVDLLMLANDRARSTMIQGETIALKRGQMAWSLRGLEREWKKSGEWIERFLGFLKDEGMVTVDSNRRRTIITILNYDVYNPPVTGTEPDSVTGTEPDSKTEQKGEMGKGNGKGEGPPPRHSEIPDDDTVQCYCADYRDLSRGVEAGIPEVWWRGWMANKLGSRNPFPNDWKRALTAAFTADLVARHPKALGMGGADLSKNKKNGGDFPGSRSPAQARFEISVELEQLSERLDAASDLCLPPDAADQKRERELKAELAALGK